MRYVYAIMITASHFIVLIYHHRQYTSYATCSLLPISFEACVHRDISAAVRQYFSIIQHIAIAETIGFCANVIPSAWVCIVAGVERLKEVFQKETSLFIALSSKHLTTFDYWIRREQMLKTKSNFFWYFWCGYELYIQFLHPE